MSKEVRGLLELLWAVVVITQVKTNVATASHDHLVPAAAVINLPDTTHVIHDTAPHDHLVLAAAVINLPDTTQVIR